jgi:hypothetical protein
VTVNDTFYCEDGSNPSPNITWEKTSGSGYYNTIPGGLLTITEDMAGDSSYSCVVQNTVGGNTSSAEVTVSFFVGTSNSEDYDTICLLGYINPYEFTMYLAVYKLLHIKNSYDTSSVSGQSFKL